MHVLIVSQVFKPEMGAAARRLEFIMHHLVRAGHKVSVATGMPNYPTGIVHPDYRGKFIVDESMDGATIYRTHYYTPPRNQSAKTQALSYLSMLPAAFYSGLRAGKPDVILVSSPPLLSALPAIWLTKVTGAKLIVDLRDLWPDELVACAGMSESSLPVRLLRKLEQSAYKNASEISCTTEAFRQTLVTRGVPLSKTFLAPNGADTDFFRPLPAQNEIADRFGFGNKFVVLYSGLMGLKHNMDSTLDAAKLLQSNEDIIFLLLGAGAKKPSLIERVANENISNVVFADERPSSEIPYIIARSNACIAGLLPDNYLDKIMLVKVFEYMACEKPVVVSVKGETARVVREAGGGYVVAPGDASGMADSILKLYNDRELCTQMGKSARQYIVANFTRERSAIRLEERIDALFPDRRPQPAVKSQEELLAEPLTNK